MQLSDVFERSHAPGTGRELVQLTSGEGFCYPLYYFIPSVTKDGQYLIYHRAQNGQVQLYRLDFATGESVRLTHAQHPDTWWYPWCADAGYGVLDHRSVLNVARNQVIYFDGNTVRTVSVGTLEDRILFRLPEDRVAIGQNCTTPDGEWFVYIHHDKKTFQTQITPETYCNSRHFSKGTELCAYNIDTGEHRLLVKINSPIHHVIPFGNEHFVFCHPTTENGMLLTDIRGGWYKHMRTQDSSGASVCHYVCNKKGIAYELLREDSTGSGSGLYNPYTDRKFEFPLPDYFGYTHTCCDEEGRLWIYESNKAADISGQNRSGDVHDLHFLAGLHPDGRQEWITLFQNWHTYSKGQKAHFHPRVMPDRKWLLFTAGDKRSQSNHIYLLDIGDLKDTKGIDVSNTL